MAKAIAEGSKMQGVDVEIKNYESPQKLTSYDALLIGAPTYHHSMTNNIKNFLEEVAFHNVNLKGKVGAAFGSYGWSGEAPRLVLEIMENRFEMKVLKPPLLVRYTADEKSLDECRKLGKKVAEQLLK